jgi:uncharacterized membrane protein
VTPERRVLSSFAKSFLLHHIRFGGAIALGVVANLVMRVLHGPEPVVAAGDTFFLSFLVMSWHFIFSLTDVELDQRADIEDEGILVVSVMTVAAIAYYCAAIFMLLNQKHWPGPLPLILTLASAPLGWFTLHTLFASHYANLYYFGPLCEDGMARGLKFPETQRPGPSDFMYFAFVIGMTAQVSDVLVQNAPMRRTVMAHGIISFFFNTVLIAMAVNAVVATVQAA